MGQNIYDTLDAPATAQGNPYDSLDKSNPYDALDKPPPGPVPKYSPTFAERVAPLVSKVAGTGEQLARNFSSDLINTPWNIESLISKAVGGPAVIPPVAPNKSIISIPEPTGTGVMAGLGKLGAQTFNSMTTPEFITQAPGAAESELVRLGFAAPMAYALPGQVAQGAQIAGDINATPAQKVVGVGTPLISAAMTAGLSGVKPRGAQLSGITPEAPIEEAAPQTPPEAQTPVPAMPANQAKPLGTISPAQSALLDKVQTSEPAKTSPQPQPTDAQAEPAATTVPAAGTPKPMAPPTSIETMLAKKAFSGQFGTGMTLADIDAGKITSTESAQGALVDQLRKSPDPVGVVNQWGDYLQASDAKSAALNQAVRSDPSLIDQQMQQGFKTQLPREALDNIAKFGQHEFPPEVVQAAQKALGYEVENKATPPLTEPPSPNPVLPEGTSETGVEPTEPDAATKAESTPQPVVEPTKNEPTGSETPPAQSYKSSGFNPPPMPEQFKSLQDVIDYRNKYRASELDFYKSLGLDDKDAAKMFRASDGRSNLDTSNIEAKLTPENQQRLDDFSTGEGSEMYQWDRQYDPAELTHEKDKSELARHVVQNLSRESLPNEFGDKMLHAVVALRQLKENGGTWSDVARELDKHTTRNSSSQGDKAEIFKMYGEKIKQFAAQQGIDLPQGEFGSKMGKSVAPKQLQPKETPAVAGEQKTPAAAVEPTTEKQPEMVGLGAATKGEVESLPTIEDQISGKQLAPPREPKPEPLVEGGNKSTINGFSDAVKSGLDKFKGWLGGMAGKTFPKTTLLSNQLGELGARWISSKIAARPKAELYTAEVLGDSGLSSHDVGAALTEDNLRSIKKAYQDKGDTEAADSVQTLIGKKGSPFKTERDYQDFLSNPKFREVVERHKDMWNSTVEPQYRNAMGIDPDVELPSRGLQTGARINLRAVQEDEHPSSAVQTAPQGNLLGTLRRKSPFGIQATGAADAYHTDLYDLMENTFGRQDEIANKNAFEKALVDSGNAVIAKPGQDVNIGGAKAVAFPLKRQTVVVEGGKSVAQNRMLYINPRIASEYRIAAKVDAVPDKGVLAAATKGMNTVAIASGTEATTHVMNLGSAIFSLPSTTGKLLNDAFLSAFGRADIPVKLVKLVMKSMQDNRAQIAGLSEIGAMRDQHTSNAPVMKYGTRLIQWMDKNTRLVLDDAYKSMVKEGLIENSETARREFVNQVGQYNTRAQPYLMGKMRQLGIAPFVTAGKNFNTLGIREATLNPGVKATSVPAALALRANMLSKWVGTAALVMSANYLLTHNKGGGVMGRVGTPLGSIDTGQKDKNGRNILVNVLNLTGQGRALRVTGLKGAIDAKKMGLKNSDAIDEAQRDMINSAISPWAGPVPRFVIGATTGYPTAVNVGRQYPVVPPGTSQHVSDFKNALIGMSPVTAGIQKAMQPQNQGWWEIVKSQFPRLVPQSGRPDSMTANFPEIVQKAQANEFTDYVIHAARTVPIAQRQQFLASQIARLPDDLQKKAWTEVKWKRAMSQ